MIFICYKFINVKFSNNRIFILYLGNGQNIIVNYIK